MTFSRSKSLGVGAPMFVVRYITPRHGCAPVVIAQKTSVPQQQLELIRDSGLMNIRQPALPVIAVRGSSDCSGIAKAFKLYTQPASLQASRLVLISVPGVLAGGYSLLAKRGPS